jgi:hypothetical protein
VIQATKHIPISHSHCTFDAHEYLICLHV